MTGQTCRSCSLRIKCSSGSGYAMYCDAHHDGRSHNGKLRVKCNQPACDQFSQSHCQQKQQPSNQLSIDFN